MYYLIVWQSDNPNDFGNSWAVDEDECNPVGETVNPCPEGSEERGRAVELCHPLVNETGWYSIICQDLAPE